MCVCVHVCVHVCVCVCSFVWHVCMYHVLCYDINNYMLVIHLLATDSDM